MEWTDARSIIISRIFVKMQAGKFDPEKGEFSHWLSRVITHAMHNILRDESGRYQRPCVKGCPFNTGDYGCSKTSTGKQCGECLAYKLWANRKQREFSIQQPLPLENHAQEVYNMMDTSLDVAGAKVVIDDKIRAKLNERELVVYQVLYVEHLDEEEAGKRLGFVKKKKSTLPAGYQQILAAKKRIVLAARQVIEEQNLT